MAHSNGTGDTEMLRAEIRQARADLGETVQALAAKADVKARVRRSAAHTAERARVRVNHAGEQVRHDPVPWAVIAAGAAGAIILLLLIRGRRG
jgi:hypothetical protein